MRKIQWYTQVDDTVGGYIVADKDLPTSAHDYRPKGDPTHRVYVVAKCHSAVDAQVIRDLLNEADYVPEVLR